jgi:hypothetical protein
LPSLDLTPVDIYGPLFPYHVDFDNIPILQLINQNLLINNAVEGTEDILRSAIGTQGTLANRLNQSLQDNGQLRTDAVDNALHNIGAHTDGMYAGISYVRMTQSERDKLGLIADEATALVIQFETISTISTTSVIPVIFDDQTVTFKASDTVTWRVESGNNVYADLGFPSAAAHLHFYDQTPAPANIITPDYKNYKSTTVATPYVEGSLRVYINGVRLSETDSVYAPGDLPADAWVLLTYTTDAANGTFALSTPITIDDVIRIDFDTTF